MSNELDRESTTLDELVWGTRHTRAAMCGSGAVYARAASQTIQQCVAVALVGVGLVLGT